MTPYDAQTISKGLRKLSDGKLQEITPTYYQMWPATVITPARIIWEMIAAEKQRRSR